MPSRPAALIVLILAALVLGFAPILVRLTDAGPAASGFWRFAFALPWLLLMTARSKFLGSGGEGIGRPSNWMALAGGMLVLDLSFWHYSIALTSVANATTLTNLTPVVVTLVGWWLFREPPRALFVVALAAAIAGAVTMSLGADGGQGSNPPLGDVFAGITALWYAGYFIAVKGARGAHSAGRVMLWSTAIAAPGLLLVALVLGEDVLPGSWGGWAACVGLGVVHVVGQGGVAWSLGRLPTALTAATVLIQPIAAAVLGWLLFAETLTLVQAIGGGVVLGAIVLAQLSSGRDQKAPPSRPDAAQGPGRPRVRPSVGPRTGSGSGDPEGSTTAAKTKTDAEAEAAAPVS